MRKLESEKRPISFNKTELEEISELSEWLGFGSLDKCHGALPKTVKFSITCLKEVIVSMAKSIPDLEPYKMDIFLSSIKKAREQLRNGINPSKSPPNS